MKLLTWNVNSVRAREARLLAVLERHKPDVACLQELKALEEQFPAEAVKAAGYHAAVNGQKTWNGVAILSREPPEDVRRGLGDGAPDPQARLVSARVAGARVICAYVPNGEEVGSEKWAYKLEWLARLRRALERDFAKGEPLVLAGDLNVAPDDKDVAKPEDWAGTVLCHEDARKALARVAAWGLADVVRKHHPEGGLYTWWDYRMLAFPKGNGLRIDHVLATAPLADRSRAASVDRDERKGEKPSDHAPVIAEFDL
ncbi:MAG: exodeoxyribonuclease III [Planctomycetales bacterium]|nr:exodeoxyribonuclease III [Planctomycetales bacterium]